MSEAPALERPSLLGIAAALAVVADLPELGLAHALLGHTDSLHVGRRVERAPG